MFLSVKKIGRLGSNLRGNEDVAVQSLLKINMDWYANLSN